MKKAVEVTREKADEIVRDRMPLGRFYFKQNGLWIGISNEKGDAEVKDFKKKSMCLKWLRL